MQWVQSKNEGPEQVSHEPWQVAHFGLFTSVTASPY